MKPYVLTIISSVSLFSCGAETNERAPAAGNQTPVTTESVVSDEETSTQAITAQVDEAISAAGEDQEAESTTGLLLTEADTKKVHTRFRSCSELDGKAVVDIKRSIERAYTNEWPMRSASTSFKLLDERTRTWSIADGAVKCSDNKKHAIVPWENIQGMTTGVKFSYAKSRESTVTNKKKSTTISTAHSVTAKGERTISWSNVASDTSIIVQKSIVSAVERELTIKKKDGQTKVLSSSVVIAADSPLITVVERDKTTKDVVSRTIKSGKVIANGKDGGKIETVYEGVKYTTENKCMASEGKISGSIFVKDASEAAVTFVITFNGESKSIVYSNGNEAEYSPDGCIFDEPEDVTEKESKDDVVGEEAAETAE
jgi:hypothetical protein